MAKASEFDERAATWDEDPAKRARAEAVAAAVRAAVPLGSGVRMLEYGAGTGLLTEALRAEVGPVTLADSSQGMLDVLRRKVADGVIPDAQVWDLDLERDPPPDERVDLVVTVMTLHHIGDLAPVLRGFASLLGDGGHLCVADLEEDDGSFHDPGFAGHHGFARDDLRRRLEAAGFRDVTFAPCHTMERKGRTYDVFLATARSGG